MGIFSLIRHEVNIVFERDPAARSKAQVFFLYPGVRAIINYRIAHYLEKRGHHFIADWISKHTRRKTGIEIHPAAEIGKGVFIDHGMGVVIGETAVVGDYCTIYQGVTLGGTGKDKGKRHPTLKNGVMVAAGAKILGPFTVGKHAKIGAGSVVLKEVPDNATVVGVPGRVVRIKGERVDDLDQNLPDPVKDEITRLVSEIEKLTARIAELEKENSENIK